MINFFQKIWAIVWKDLTSELRTKEMILSMCLFSFLVLIIFNFAFETHTKTIPQIIPGILWVSFVFAGIIGLSRSFGTETDKGTLPGLLLCPVSPWGIYLAKLTATFILTVIMEIFTILIFILLYNLNLLPKARDKILSILIFPISVPMIIAVVKATGTILDGKAIQEIYAWLKILIAFDLVFLLLAYLTFGFIMEE
jgi:heme exporter protein B